MAHGLADGGQGDVLAPRYAGPAVTRDVCGQRDVQTEAQADPLELAVDQMSTVLILLPLVLLHVPYDRQHVGRCASVILVDDVLHRFLPLYCQQLVRLPSPVGENTVLKVVLSEKSHVDKGHAAGVEREHEQVAGIVHRGTVRQVHVAYAAYDAQRNRPLYGLADARVDMAEWIALNGEVTLDGTVVDGPEIAHVVRRRVGTQSSVLQPVFICQHEVGIEIRQGDIPAVAEEANETVERRRIGRAHPALAYRGEMGGERAGESDEAGAGRGCSKKGNHAGGGVWTSASVQPEDDVLQPEDVTTDFLVHHRETLAAAFVSRRRNRDAPVPAVPFVWKEPVAGAYLTGDTSVNNLIIQCPLPACDGRRTVLYFYCCHITLNKLIMLRAAI